MTDQFQKIEREIFDMEIARCNDPKGASKSMRLMLDVVRAADELQTWCGIPFEDYGEDDPQGKALDGCMEALTALREHCDD